MDETFKIHKLKTIHLSGAIQESLARTQANHVDVKQFHESRGWPSKHPPPPKPHNQSGHR